MESMNDEDAADFIGCEEDQASVRVASLEKLVDYCAEEFSKFCFHVCVFPTLLFVRRFVCFSQFVVCTVFRQY